MTSSVLAGFNMQYKTSDYTARINKAFETCLEEIANIKYLVCTNSTLDNSCFCMCIQICWYTVCDSGAVNTICLIILQL